MPPTATSPTAKHCSERLQRPSSIGWLRGCKARCADAAQLRCRRATGCELSGLFTAAFFGADLAAVPIQTAIAPPYVALVEALDAMVDAGVLPPERRDGAEWPCWSAVHGFAELALHGPLRGASRREVESLAGRTVDDIIAGLSR